MGYNTLWIADYAVVSITVDSATSETEAELESYDILCDYVKEPDLFHLDEVTEMNS